MTARYNSISDEAVRDATDKTWDEWFTLLDEAGASKLSHTEIAAMLTEQGHIDEGDSWWAQTITVGYEYARGRRVKGQTGDAGFQVGVQRTIRVEPGRLWDFLTNPEGLSIWLGPGIDSLPLEKGSTYQTDDGTAGKIRSVYPEEKLRLTWHPAEWANDTTLQLYFEDKGDRTALRFHHERLADQNQRRQMKEHWRQVLEEIKASF